MRTPLLLLFLAGLCSSAEEKPNALLEEGVAELLNEPNLAAVRDYHSTVFTSAQNMAVKAGVTYGVGNFSCPSAGPSAEAPTSVHALRPGDIAVVAALGDSLTAGNGAGGSVLGDVLTEYRGLSFSIGGDGDLAQMTTIPNILRELNPSLIGASEGVGPVYLEERSHLNVAVPGAKFWDLPAQAEELIKRIKADDSINITADWKLVTLFIGTNDLCQACQGKDEKRKTGDPFVAPPTTTEPVPWWRRRGETQVPWWRRTRGSAAPWWQRTFATRRPWWKPTESSTAGPSTAPTPTPPSTARPERIAGLKSALKKLHDELPRTLVSLVNVEHAEELAETHDQSFLCRLMHRVECPCLVGSGYSKAGFTAVVEQLQGEIRSAAADAGLADRDDFAVVLQPLLEGAKLPRRDGKVDLAFLAPDCFHWSQLGHSYVAAGLWKNLLAPKAAKNAAFLPDLAHPEELACPDPACPFLRTDANSADCTPFLPTEGPSTTEAPASSSAAPTSTTAAPTSTTTDLPTTTEDLPTSEAPPAPTVAPGNSSGNSSQLGPHLPLYLDPEQGDSVASAALLPAVLLMAAANAPEGAQVASSFLTMTIVAGVGLVAISGILIGGVVYKASYQRRRRYRRLERAQVEMDAPEGLFARVVRRASGGGTPEGERTPLLDHDRLVKVY